MLAVVLSLVGIVLLIVIIVVVIRCCCLKKGKWTFTIGLYIKKYLHLDINLLVLSALVLCTDL